MKSSPADVTELYFFIIFFNFFSSSVNKQQIYSNTQRV